MVGILNNSSNWALILGLFSFLIYERMECRKNLLVTLNILSRLLICSIVFIPLLHAGDTATLTIVSILVSLGSILWGIYSVGFNIWLMSSVPKNTRNQFIYTRTMWLRISFTVTSLVMGYVLDWFNKSYAGFLIIFTISLGFSILDAVVLTKIDEPANKVEHNHKFNSTEFLEPLRNHEYRKMLTFVFLYYFSLTLSSSYTSLYQIRYLGFNYGFISTIYVITYFLMIVCTRFWSRLEREKGMRFVLKTSGLVAITEFFVYAFLTSERVFLFPIAAIIAGIGNSGFNIAIFNYRYEVMPDNNRTIYEGWYGAIFGISVLLSPIAGDIFMKVLPTFENTIFQYSGFQLRYFISFILAFIVIVVNFSEKKKII